ncbi:MAG: 3'-5' exonuclease [Clostridia bacterium]|jgi:hypothetical protein
MLMIDTECIGFVTQIGACYFNDKGEIEEKFLINISMESCIKHGLQIDAKELRWWLERDKPDWLKDSIDIRCALGRFREFCKRDVLVWSHNYDMYKLQIMYGAIGERIPFPYRNWRDIRTLVWLAGLNSKKEEDVTHNALDDAIRQVDYVSKCLEVVREKTKIVKIGV